MIAEIRLLSRNTFFDEQPCTEISSEEVDFRAASELFAAVSRPLNSFADEVLAEMGTGPKDPYRTYVLKEGYPE
jgi:hypothetical protein